MSLKKIRARILNITYDRDNNLFKLSLRDLDRAKHTNIAIKGTDWGVTPDIPDDIVEQFCKDMMGKDKNLFIETEKTDMPSDISKTEGVVTPDELFEMHDNIDKYPIKELENEFRKDKNNEG